MYRDRSARKQRKLLLKSYVFADEMSGINRSLESLRTFPYTVGSSGS